MDSLLFVTSHGFYPEAAGGGQLSAMSLLGRLQAIGWRIEVVAGLLAGAGAGDGCDMSYAPYWRRDSAPGYPCYRSLRRTSHLKALIARRIAALQPSVVLGGHDCDVLPYLEYPLKLGISTCYFARCIDQFREGFRFPTKLRLLGNSPVTAAHLGRFSDRQVTVVRPLIERQRFLAEEGDRRYITFINPIPEKGVHVATAVARLLPHAEFLFVKGKWSTYATTRDTLSECATLANVKIIDFQEDMRPVYRATRILFMPSQFDETAGRVIVEANANGIPVVASAVCGIPDQLGKGGFLVAPKDDVEQFANALRTLLTDRDLYTHLSGLARQNGMRPEFSPETQFAVFLDFLRSL